MSKMSYKQLKENIRKAAEYRKTLNSVSISSGEILDIFHLTHQHEKILIKYLKKNGFDIEFGLSIIYIRRYY